MPQDQALNYLPGFPQNNDSNSSSASSMDENDPIGTFDTTSEDLENLYQRALETMEEVENDLNFASEVLNRPADQAVAEDESAQATQTIVPPSPEAKRERNSEGPNSLKQIIEAALFVGGKLLTKKKLCALLQGDFQADDVVLAIEKLNLQYEGEERPYIIHLGEGGYRMAIREEYDAVRNRVFGLGPKEVRLSQDALEVLAFIAYRQPVTSKDLEQIQKKSSHGILQQLIRRQLVVIDREEHKTREAVAYKTSDRFLKVFGISHLEELPIAEELEFK